jgi:hypothetical protein
MSDIDRNEDHIEPGRPMMLDDGPPMSTADLADGPSNTTADVAAEPRSFREETRADGHGERAAPLLAQNEVAELRDHWTNIQAAFVDEPRKAVQDADGLVAQAMKRLAETFANERSSLEKQWDQGDQVSTEDLRVALQRYRSFFDRLLSV